MPDCNETIRELDAFLDGELSVDTRTQIHHHLNGCTDCLQAFDFHAELKRVVQRKCNSDEMPEGLLGRIEACFATEFERFSTDSSDPAGKPWPPNPEGDSAPTES
jgi:mycothiol system anti-sigma-R factor